MPGRGEYAGASGPTTPSPGPGYTWDAATNRWVPPATAGRQGGGAPPPPPSAGAPPPPPEHRTGGGAPPPMQPMPQAGGSGLTDSRGPGASPASNPDLSTPVTPEIQGHDYRTPDPRQKYYDQKAVADDVAAAREGRDKFLSSYDNYKPREAPQAAAPGAINVTTSATPKLGPAAQTAPTTVGPAVQVKPVADITAPTIDPIERYKAATIGQTPGAQAGNVTAATMDVGTQDDIRRRQLDLLNKLENPNGPSLAELQMQRGNEEAMASQYALAGAQRGFGAGAALRQAGRNVAALQQKNVLDTSMLRAKEDQDRRAQLLQGYDSTRGTDVDVAKTQAGFQQQANVTNAQLNTQTNISNADRDAARAMKQADLEQAAAAGNAAAQNELNNRQAAMRLDAAKANQATQTTVNTTNATEQNKLNALQAQLTQQGGQFNAAQLNDFAKTQADMDLKNSQFNASQANDAEKTKFLATVQTNLANLDAKLKQQGMDDAQRDALLKAYLQNQSQALGWDISAAGIQAGKDAAWQQFGMNLVGAGVQAGAAAAMASDRRVKKNVELLYSDDDGKKGKRALLDGYGGKDELGEMLSKLRPVRYKYKDPDADGAAKGQRWGIIAQDLERSPVGKSLVIDDGGVKKIDTAQAVGVLLAAMARMEKKPKERR